MRNSPFWWILIGVMVLLDIYVFQVVKLLSHSVGQSPGFYLYTLLGHFGCGHYHPDYSSLPAF